MLEERDRESVGREREFMLEERKRVCWKRETVLEERERERERQMVEPFISQPMEPGASWP